MIITKTLHTIGTEQNLLSLEKRNPLGLFEFNIKEKNEQLINEFELKHPVRRNNLMEKEKVAKLWILRTKKIPSLNF